MDNACQQVGRLNVTNDDTQRVTLEHETGDAGIGMTSVLVMLAVLAVLVVGIFWMVPAWFGGQVVEVTIRN
jgi:hypothetical protein